MGNKMAAGGFIVTPAVGNYCGLTDELCV